MIRYRGIAAFLLAFALSSAPVFSEEPPRATWVWDTRLLLYPKEQASLLKFCHSHRIGTLYLFAYNLKAPMDQVYREFLRQAHREGLSVYALGGDPRWGQPRYHPVPLAWIESIRQFNGQVSVEERFDGVHTDIEVYLLAKSWSEHPEALLGGYLDLHAKIAEILKSDRRPMGLGVDVPFWFDDDTAWRILWHGVIRPPSHHMLDIADSITVLAYRNAAEGSDGTIQLVSLEMDYADRIGKKVFIGQETQKDLFPAYVTFGGTSCAVLERELKKIFKVMGHRPSFGGFAIHHYESYQKLCGE